MEWKGEENLFLLLISLAVLALCIYVNHAQCYWKRNNVVTPPYHFLLGHSLPRILKAKSSSEQFDDFYREYKGSTDLVGLYFATTPAVLALDLDLIKRVMITDYEVFNSRGVYVNEKDDPISEHLFSMGGTKWRKLRNKLSPTFTSGKLKMMFPTMVKISENFVTVVDGIAKANPDGFMIKNVTSRFTTDVIGNCAFGLDCNSLLDPENNFRAMGDKFFRRTFSRALKNLFMLNFSRFSRALGLKSTPNDVSTFFTKTVSDTVRYRETNEVSRNDFLDLLIKIKNDDNVINRLTLQEIVSQSFIFFVAGFETSSSTMLFALFELSKRPDIQEKARNDIRSAMAKHGGVLTYECLQEMDYLEKVVYETLRKYPAVPVLSRKADKDYKVPDSNVVIKQDTIVFIPVQSIHMDPNLYPNPEEFDPHRFDKELTGTRHPCAYMVFGEGPRICVGLRFGMMQAKIGLVALLTAFKFSQSNETEDPIVMDKFTVLLMPRDDIHLKVERVSDI